MKDSSKRVIKSAISDTISQTILGEYCHLWTGDSVMVPVAGQIDGYREIGKNYGISYKQDYFFQKISPLLMATKKSRGVFFLDKCFS